MKHTPKYVGLSLVEVVVVLAIIAVLIVILVPAIQAARETARRAACANKLHQIGIAIASYETASGVYPPGGVFWIGKGANIRPGGPWNVEVILLPYLGRKDLYNSLNLELPVRDAGNSTVVANSVGQYLCPSDGTPVAGAGNYFASIGSGVFRAGWDVPIDPITAPPADGFIGRGSLRPTDISDGLSHTSAFHEQIHGTGTGLALKDLPVPTLGIIYGLQINPPTQKRLLEMCDDLSSASRLHSPAGIPWADALAVSHLVAPNRPSCWGQNLGSHFSAITASSRHRHGVNVLLLDGQVRFVQSDIDLDVWRAIGSRNGGEQINF